MASITEIQPYLASRPPAAPSGDGATIIIFPGVRYERHVESSGGPEQPDGMGRARKKRRAATS